MSREEHNKFAKIDNLIWEVAKIISPEEYIDPEKIKHAKEALLKILAE